MPRNAPEIQVVISGWFLLFLAVAGSAFGYGYWLLTHPPPPEIAETASYYVSRAVTSVRPCYKCLGPDGKLKAQSEWTIGKATEIPEGEQWWFAPVDEVLTVYKVDGVSMLAVHPARDQKKPWEGFSQRQVVLVVNQDVEGRNKIEHPPPPPTTPPAADQPQVSESSQEAPQDGAIADSGQAATEDEQSKATAP